VSAAVAPGGAAGARGTVSAANAPARTFDTRKRVGAALVSIVDNAFHRVTDRPLVRLHAGGRLIWRWDSQQSHQVSVRSGPRRLQSPTRNDGRFSARLTQPGRYVFVCKIHAPGMRMTVDVR
jgi:plastocyanin